MQGQRHKREKERKEKEIRRITMTQEQIEETQLQITALILQCRDLEKRVKGFGMARLDEVAESSGMPPELKKQVKVCIEDPTKEFEIKFKPNE